MSTTAKWVFDKAIYLMDEQNESSGATLTADTREYYHRTLGILNVLRHELYPISDTYQWPEAAASGGVVDVMTGIGSVAAGTKRPIVAEITSFEDEIGLDDAVAQGIMPYGLAAHLLLGENDAMANYFSQRYMEMYAQLRGSLPSAWEDIPCHYGGLNF